MLFFDLCIQGVIQGAIYALIALGLTLVYGLLRILHVAHAALFTLGGYIGVIVTNGSGSFLLALMTAMLIVGVVGMSSYKIIYKPLLNRTPLIALIASIGIFIASEEFEICRRVSEIIRVMFLFFLKEPKGSDIKGLRELSGQVIHISRGQFKKTLVSLTDIWSCVLKNISYCFLSKKMIWSNFNQLFEGSNYARLA